MFIAPADVPKGNKVTVTGFSSTDHSKSAAAPVTITSTIAAIAVTLAPPPLLPAGALASVAAMVTGDATNAGVDWSLTCSTAPNCGSISQHTDNGAVNVFTAPSVLQAPAIVGTSVTIIATSTADPNFSAQAVVMMGAPISVQLTQPPPNTMLTGAMSKAVAVTTNDVTNAGVDWSVQCQNAPCGSFSLNHTASGAVTTFTAPATVPLGSNIVTVIATSTADPTQTAIAMVTVNAPISVQITQGVANNTLVANMSAQLIADVSNDPTGSGVDWTVTCGSADCGSLVPPHTDSGSPTMYTAPAAPPAGNTVTITATATADKNQDASTPPITITASIPPNSLLTGNFVFSLTGRDANQSFYSLSGTIVGDGNGNITSGEADGLDSSNGGITNLSGSYSIGRDGRGQITLNLLNTNNFPSFGVINVMTGVPAVTVSVTFVTPKHALLSETDSFGTGVGTLDFQDPNALAAFQNGAPLNGTYAIALSGTEVATPSNRFFLASALTVQFSAAMVTVTETGAVGDQSDNGVVTADAPATAGVGAQIGGLTADLFGRFFDQGAIDLGPNRLNLSAYLIDANHFVINDFRDNFVFGGYMVLEPPAPAISGTYAFAEAGATASPGFVPQVAGGVFTCGAVGTLDVTPSSGTPTVNHAVTAACLAPASGRGLITISGAAATGISEFAAYPTIDEGLRLIEIDGSGPAGAGVALQQIVSDPIGASAFNGKYASNLLASTAKGLEALVGQIASDGTSALSGVADVNSFDFGTTENPPVAPTGTPSPNATLSGSFTANNNGRLLLTLNITPAPGPPPQPAAQITVLHPACYIVDAETCLLLGLDAVAPSVGIARLQHTGL